MKNNLCRKVTCKVWMIRSGFNNIFLITFLIAGFLFIISILPVFGQMTLEEMLEDAKEKLRQAELQGLSNSQSNQSSNSSTNIYLQQRSSQEEWATVVCPLCDLSLEYPPTVLDIAQPDEDRFKKEHSIYFYDNTTGFFRIKYIVGTPNENVTYEDVKKLRDWWLAGDRFHNSYFIVEDINMTKWKIDGEVTGSFILGREPRSPAITEGMEILLTYHNNRQYFIEFITNATIFDTPYIQDTEKRLIESIKWLN